MSHVERSSSCNSDRDPLDLVVSFKNSCEVKCPAIKL